MEGSRSASKTRVAAELHVPGDFGTLDFISECNGLIVNNLDEWHFSSGGPVGWPGRPVAG